MKKGGQFLSGDWPNALSTRSAARGTSYFPWLVVKMFEGDALKDTRLVMEMADDDLISLVNTQRDNNKEVMGVVREWVGLLLKYNIHWVYRRVPVNLQFEVTFQISPPK